MVVLYPGTFDPITYGHLNIIERCAQRFEKVIVAVADNGEKLPLFSVPERMRMIKEACARWPNVEVDAFQGLLVDYAQRRGVQFIVKGLRAVSDFEYELQMALTNRKLAPEMETLFMMCDSEFLFLSSSVVKEVARHGGPVDHLVPPAVEASLKAVFGEGGGPHANLRDD